MRSCIREPHRELSRGALSLLSFPLISVPAYWVFGRRKFEGYVLASKTNSDITQQLFENLEEVLSPYISDYGDTNPEVRAAERLARVGLMKGND
jgi:cardiolipin synthase